MKRVWVGVWAVLWGLGFAGEGLWETPLPLSKGVYETPLQQDSILDVHAGNAVLSVPNNGAIGFWSSDQMLGLGFLYPGMAPNVLYYGSFALGIDASYVADAWYESNQIDDRDFRPQQGLFHASPGPRNSVEAVWGTFDDSGHPTNPQGIVVDQLAYAYDHPDYDDFIILEYRLTAPNPVSGVYVGYFMDFDIDAYSQNEAAIDSTTRLAYQWFTASSRYAGVVLLTPTTPANLSVLNNPLFVYPYVGCPDSIQIKFLNGTYSFASSWQPDDWSVVVSAGPFTISSDPTIVAFAVVGGLSASDIIANAQHAIDVYNDTTLVGVSETIDHPVSFRFRVTPNIVRDHTTLNFEIPSAAQVAVDLLDPTGRRVQSLNLGHLLPGRHQIGLSLPHLPQGAYFIQIRDASKVLGTQRILKIQE